MIIDSKTIKDVFHILGINSNKNLGQNFLINPKIANDIVACLHPDLDSYILEIGSGLGSLTHFLVNSHLDIVEIDKSLVRFLKDTYPNDNINIYNDDILQFDVSKYEYIISNLPYYITTDIVTYLLLHAKRAKRIVLMMQKEAAGRFMNLENNKDYGPVSILIHLLGNIQKEFYVGKNNFYPIPCVDSVVLSIDIDTNKRTETNFKIYKMCTVLFKNRRKTILNNLTNYLKSKEKASEILKKVNIEANLRPENITIEQYCKLYYLLNN